MSRPRNIHKTDYVDRLDRREHCEQVAQNKSGISEAELRDPVSSLIEVLEIENFQIDGLRGWKFKDSQGREYSFAAYNSYSGTVTVSTDTGNIDRPLLDLFRDRVVYQNK